MPQYPPSSFESLVGNFLNSYGAVKGIQRDRSEQAIREQQAKRQDQMAQVQLDEAGYSRLTMPTIGPPPDESFTQKVGRFLSGGTPAPSEVIVKTHPSAHDTDVANAQAFETSRDTAHYANERAIEELKIAAQTAESRNRNKTAITVAGIDHDAQSRALEDKQRTEFFDNAVAEAGGDPVQAMKNVERFQMPQAKKYGATRMDYHAAAARRNAPGEELKKARAELDLQRAGQVAGQSQFMAPPGVKPPPGPKTAAPSPTAAARLSPLADTDKQAAQKDPGFASHLQSLGYVKGRDF